MRSLLLIISGSVAAYKSLELIRLLRARNIAVDAILTRGGAEFITPLVVSSLTGEKTYTDLFSLTDEAEMGHIRLARRHDAVLVAPASANLLAKMATGIADDLATTTLLATDRPVWVAPAMNVKMWEHPATRRNLEQLRRDGVRVILPQDGSLACGETGAGRMQDPALILETLLSSEESGAAPLHGKKIIVTAGPTHEPIDPVRYIGNLSSGKQGIAIAAALAAQGADVQLVLGPSAEAVPAAADITLHRVTTARQMLDQCLQLLPADIAICAAAVADWRTVNVASHKLKKRQSGETPTLQLAENPDILATLAQHPQHRPTLVIGFAAETNANPEELSAEAQSKLDRKQCDWLIANDVSAGNVFGSEYNRVVFFRRNHTETQEWSGTKHEIAGLLSQEIVKASL